MSNNLDAAQKFKLAVRVGKVIDDGEAVSLVDFTSEAAEAIGCTITEGNIMSACSANETTIAKVFARPAELVEALQQRVAELHQEIDYLRELLSKEDTLPKEVKAWVQRDGAYFRKPK